MAYLELTRVPPIRSGIELDIETITELAKRIVHIRDIRSIFATGNGLPMQFICDVKCDRCDVMQKRMLNKTQLISYMELIHMDEFGDNKRNCQTVATCGVCKDKENAEKKVRHFASTLSYQKEILRDKEINNKIIIEGYLNIGVGIKDGCTWRDAEKDLRRRIKNCDHKMIATEIKEMDYSDFLKTPYWKIISFLVKKENGFKCVMCNSKENLHVHHKSYELHGYEHTVDGFNLLTSVCSECHEKHHQEFLEPSEEVCV
jgi:hypothetical protein